MNRFLLLIGLCLLTLTACGAPAATPIPTQTAAFSNGGLEPTSTLPLLATPTSASATNLPTQELTSTELPPTETFTPYPTQTPNLPTPTETPMPTLELPEVQSREPDFRLWRGMPTYPGDSNEAFLFALRYDPEVWAQTDGLLGETVLASRQISGCTISSWSGRGLPIGWKAEHSQELVGELIVDFSQVFANEELQFVTYTFSDTRIVSAFQVTFTGQPHECLDAAQKVVYTFRSVRGAPTATPTASSTMEPSPSATLAELTATHTLEPSLPTETSQPQP